MWVNIYKKVIHCLYSNYYNIYYRIINLVSENKAIIDARLCVEN